MSKLAYASRKFFTKGLSRAEVKIRLKKRNWAQIRHQRSKIRESFHKIMKRDDPNS